MGRLVTRPGGSSGRLFCWMKLNTLYEIQVCFYIYTLYFDIAKVQNTPVCFVTVAKLAKNTGYIYLEL